MNQLFKLAAIAVDLDGTLAKAIRGKFDPEVVGEPVPKMLARVKQWLKDDEVVKIFTARASDPKNVPVVKKWLREHGIGACEVTNEKTPDIEKIYDDRAVSVEHNTGVLKSAVVEGMASILAKAKSLVRAKGVKINVGNFPPTWHPGTKAVYLPSNKYWQTHGNNWGINAAHIPQATLHELGHALAPSRRVPPQTDRSRFARYFLRVESDANQQARKLLPRELKKPYNQFSQSSYRGYKTYVPTVFGLPATTVNQTPKWFASNAGHPDFLPYVKSFRRHAQRADPEANLAMKRMFYENQDLLSKSSALLRGFKALNPAWRVTVQNAQRASPKLMIPGYVQFDNILRGQNIWSQGPEKLMRRGFNVPDFSPLPQGQYTVEQATRALERLRKGRPLSVKRGSVVGIPDRRNYGDPSTLKPGTLLDYVIQRHLARRAGPHFDVRAGTPGMGLLSWATKKNIPSRAGQRIALYQQPLHSWDYRNFEGTLPPGYGQGTVSKEKEGQLLVTRSTPTAISFSTASGPVIKRFTLVKPRTPYDRSWLLIRAATPGPLQVGKETFQTLTPEAAENLMANLQENAVVQPKVDGALAFIRLAKNRAEILSHRTSKRTGQPIFHTERFFGKIPDVQYPKGFENSVLTGELFGERGGEAIPPQELGGILNAGLARSLQKQKEQDVALKTMLFGISEMKGRPVELPYSEQRQKLEELLAYLPKDKFLLPEEARTPEEAMEMFRAIRAGENPLTREGIVIHPEDGTPMKTKLRPEADVYIRNILEGTGRLSGSGAGAFEYSVDPESPILGRVGTGLSDELRQELWKNPELYLGRRARITSQGQFPSGAHRAPSLIALHEG